VLAAAAFQDRARAAGFGHFAGHHAALASGVFLWCVYGVLIASWPVIMANAVTLLFILAILGLKLRYG
jgi:MtN3 and saliva related transmembrane protein